MELRVLQYFLAIAREESISRAAESLHLSQPTLSRQLKEMEDELGKQLVIRGSHNVTLTDEGMILRKRAEEIMELVRRTEDEITLADEDLAGEICFAAGETDGFRVLARIIRGMRKEYPQVSYHFSSGNAPYVRERLDRGLADFGLIYGEVESSRYDSLPLPIVDRWGILMRRDSPLARKKAIRPSDLWDKPLIIPQQSNHVGEMMKWLQQDRDSLSVVATFNLIINASLLVSEGVGYAVVFENLINVTGDSNLCIRPLLPTLETRASLIWKKYQPLGRAPQKFLELLREDIGDAEEDD